jgi:Zn finger protein HypA/HybF involved in hydrogenase expression
MRKHSEHTARPEVEVVYCPKCEAQPMRLVAAKPLLFASGAEEFHYKCRECGAQDLRIVGHSRH